ncbi:TadE/TadG family type IV pilus assembly protein [Castellaniella sp.]|uniref:TadE/TadG family type IV pilus assembly protein n=1 Tax=Castellaniella sp. TaxID=1955812 RepID=UPI003C748199
MNRVRSARDQSGIAAIELSLTLIVLLMLVFAIVSYGALFWAQQSLIGVAADAARHGLSQSYAASAAGGDDAAASEALQEQVGEYACGVAVRTAVLQAFWPAATPEACAASGFVETIVRACPADVSAGAAGLRCLTVHLALDVKGWPLLNTMDRLADLSGGMLPGDASPEHWIPETLRAKSVVVIAPSLASGGALP